MSQTEQLREAVRKCYERERAIIQEINALSEGAPEVPPLELPRGLDRAKARRARKEHKEAWRKSQGECGQKVAALEAERLASIGRRRKLQAGLAGLLGQEARAKDRRGRTITAAINEALAALGEPKDKGGAK